MNETNNNQEQRTSEAAQMVSVPARNIEAAAVSPPRKNEDVMSLPDASRHKQTTEEIRDDAVGRLLAEGMARVTSLKLTPEEKSALTAPFPDEAFELGAGGDPSLIYLSHVWLRLRCNEVLGPGEAIFLRRKCWAERYRNRRGDEAVRVYFDGILLVRGVLVGEGIGDASYDPGNPRQTYSDALEAAKSNAFRRAWKDFGVGLQAWMSDWVEGWKKRHPEKVVEAYRKAQQLPHPDTLDYEIYMSQVRAAKSTSGTKPIKTTTPTAASAPEQKETPEEKRQRWIKLCLEAGNGMAAPAEVVLSETGRLGEFTKLDELPLESLPKTKAEAEALLKAIREQARQMFEQQKESTQDAKAPQEEQQVPEPTGDTEELRGWLAAVTSKVASNGSTRFSLCLTENEDQKEGGTWVSTFNTNAAAIAKAFKGHRVIVHAVKTEYGYKLVGDRIFVQR